RVSADVLLEGPRERAERRGLFWIRADVIACSLGVPPGCLLRSDPRLPTCVIPETRLADEYEKASRTKRSLNISRVNWFLARPNNEKRLTAYPRWVSNRLCLAHPCSTIRHSRSTNTRANCRAFWKILPRHGTTTMPPPWPPSTRRTPFL